MVLGYYLKVTGFQFLGIPPKGEQRTLALPSQEQKSFQFLGIPPKGEQVRLSGPPLSISLFPISRDPPEGGTGYISVVFWSVEDDVSNF